MEEIQQQTINDFLSFLAGNQAPALVGSSLAKVMRTDVQTISRIVVSWASRVKTGAFEDIVLQARRKVFDIFFFRIVPPARIYDFFPKFEKLLIALCPTPYQQGLEAKFAAQPWQNLRPIADLDRMPLFAVTTRNKIEVKADGFNEDVYKNVTHNLLSAKSRYVFPDAATSEMVAEHSAKINYIFQNFVDQVRDRHTREEIAISNEADKDAVYEVPTRFSFEDYFLQSVDLAVAFFNDEYLFHSVRMMDLVTELAEKNKYDLANSVPFQSKHKYFSAAKIEDYITSRTNRVLVRRLIGWFEEWQPARLMQLLRGEDNRRTRRTLFNILECYGSSLYSQLLEELGLCKPGSAWQHAHGLISLLGRLVPPSPASAKLATDLIEPHLNPRSSHALNMQCIATLVHIGTDHAVSGLGLKLDEFSQSSAEGAMEVAHRIAISLLGIGSGKNLEKAFTHLFKEWSDEIAEQVSQSLLSPAAVEPAAQFIRKELRKLKMTFNFLGDEDRVGSLLKALSSSQSAEVILLCREIRKTLSPRHKLAVLAEEVLARASEPGSSLVADIHLNQPALEKNVPEMLFHIHDAKMDGTFQVKDSRGLNATLDFEKGDLVHAEITPVDMDRDNVFYWAFLLEPRDVELIVFRRPAEDAARPERPPQEGLPTPLLLKEALLQRGEVRQMSGAILLPESRFCRRPAAEVALRFRGAEDPDHCMRVWEALEKHPDIPTLQEVTQLSKYDLYKILFFMIRKGLAALYTDARPSEKSTVDEGLAMLDEYLGRIAARPVLFNLYRAASQLCGSLAESSADGTVKGAMNVLGRYFSDAWAQHQVFTETNLDLCAQVAGLVGLYVAKPSGENRNALLDYVRFAFEETIAAEPAAPPAEAAPTPLQALESIELGSDAFDEGIDILFNDESVGDFLGELDRAFSGGGAGEGVGTGARAASMTAAEEEMLMELYDHIASAYVKPLKDFIREIKLNSRISKPVSASWLEIVEPSLRLLLGSAEKMGAERICRELAGLKTALEGYTMSGSIPDAAQQKILAHYEQLSALLTRTFSLVPTEADLNSKKEVLITRFILRQVTELTEKQRNRIILAGLSTFDKFMQSSPDEIAAVTGLPRELSEEVFMKFYQYRHVYYRPDDEEYRDKFIRVFEVKLSVLRETHAEIEKVALIPDSPETRERMKILQADRQQTFWGLIILLCIKEEYELIETLQHAVYEVRFQKLEAYLEKLCAVDAAA
ncbi:MAG: hypothetical protein KA419_11020 [Acidobacteria bacterium]|nr:hypothetical protein [Acidobacteriota bacterium]